MLFSKNNDLIKVSALLIHAAKIDQNYSIKEKEIIEQAIFKLGADSKDIKKIIEDAWNKKEQINKN